MLRRWSTASNPFLVTADDGASYVVKSNLAGRQMVNDQIVARLGESISAPTGRPTLVSIDDAFLDLNPDLRNSGVTAGTWHGVRFVANHTEREGIQHCGLPENKLRFAALALLYGWAMPADHQFIYSNAPPPLVLSVDHGHFFAGGPNWTVDTLRGVVDPARPDQSICQTCQLTDADLSPSKQQLQEIDAVHVIAGAVAMPPDAWQIALQERVAMAEYLDRRRTELLA
jgi:hypothetical protein